MDINPSSQDTAMHGMAVTSPWCQCSGQGDGRLKCEQIGNILSSHNRHSGRKIELGVGEGAEEGLYGVC